MSYELKLYPHALLALRLHLDSLKGDLTIGERARYGDKQAQYIIADNNLHYTVDQVARYVVPLRGQRPHEVLGIAEDASLEQIEQAVKANAPAENGGRADILDAEGHQTACQFAATLMKNHVRNPSYSPAIGNMPRLEDVCAMQDMLARELQQAQDYVRQEPKPATVRGIPSRAERGLVGTAAAGGVSGREKVVQR